MLSLRFQKSYNLLLNYFFVSANPVITAYQLLLGGINYTE